MITRWLLAMLLAISIGGSAGAGAALATSEARAIPYDDGIVDLLIIGPAAKTLYDRLPGRGEKSACGDMGLHKGDGRMVCVKEADDYSCHVWLDVPRQALTNAETDDC